MVRKIGERYMLEYEARNQGRRSHTVCILTCSSSNPYPCWTNCKGRMQMQAYLHIQSHQCSFDNSWADIHLLKTGRRLLEELKIEARHNKLTLIWVPSQCAKIEADELTLIGACGRAHKQPEPKGTPGKNRKAATGPNLSDGGPILSIVWP